MSNLKQTTADTSGEAPMPNISIPDITSLIAGITTNLNLQYFVLPHLDEKYLFPVNSVEEDDKKNYSIAMNRLIIENHEFIHEHILMLFHSEIKQIDIIQLMAQNESLKKMIYEICGRQLLIVFNILHFWSEWVKHKYVTIKGSQIIVDINWTLLRDRIKNYLLKMHIMDPVEDGDLKFITHFVNKVYVKTILDHLQRKISPTINHKSKISQFQPTKFLEQKETEKIIKKIDHLQLILELQKPIKVKENIKLLAEIQNCQQPMKLLANLIEYIAKLLSTESQIPDFGIGIPLKIKRFLMKCMQHECFSKIHGEIYMFLKYFEKVIISVSTQSDKLIKTMKQSFNE